MEHGEMERVLWNFEEAQKHTGFSRQMIYQLLNRSDCGVVRIGRRKFFHRETFLKWLKDQAEPGRKGA